MVSSRRDIATAMRTACVTWRQLSGFCESCARSRQPPSPNAKLSPAGEHAAAAAAASPMAMAQTSSSDAPESSWKHHA